MAIRPDFRQGPLGRQRIARRRFAVFRQAQDGALVRGQVLRLLARQAVTDAQRRIATIGHAHQQSAIRQPQQARTEVLAAALVRGHLEQGLDARHLLAVEHAAHEGRAVGVVVACRYRHVHTRIRLGRVLRMNDDVEQAALPARKHLGHAFQRHVAERLAIQQV
ncbi:hypothetical protein D3C72_1713280 [compost metagenome]